MENEILEMYYCHHLKQKDIAIKLNVSTSKVSRVISKDNRYKAEKEYRKNLSQKDHRSNTIKYIQEKRKANQGDISYAILKQQHSQASSELSSRKNNISNKAFRDWNSSIYKYNSKTKSYDLKKEIVVGSDVPKRIKW